MFGRNQVLMERECRGAYSRLGSNSWGATRLNCTPLNIQNKILTIGASHPQWRQALQYNRLELIESLKSYGYQIKEIRIRQHYPNDLVTKVNEKEIWEKHPSRTDKTGITNCPLCKVPSPKGEVKLWGKCSFCRRKELRID